MTQVWKRVPGDLEIALAIEALRSTLREALDDMRSDDISDSVRMVRGATALMQALLALNAFEGRLEDFTGIPFGAIAKDSGFGA